MSPCTDKLVLAFGDGPCHPSLPSNQGSTSPQGPTSLQVSLKSVDSAQLWAVVLQASKRHQVDIPLQPGGSSTGSSMSLMSPEPHAQMTSSLGNSGFRSFCFFLSFSPSFFHPGL